MPIPDHLQSHPLFSGGKFGLMSGDAPTYTATLQGHEELIRTLNDMGLAHIQTQGKYNNAPERSVIIKNPTRQHMETLGRIFGQEAVIYSEGRNHQYLFTNGPDAGKTVGTVAHNPVDFFPDPPSNNYTYLPGHGYFRINFDFGQDPDSEAIKPHVPVSAPAMAKSERSPVVRWRLRKIEILDPFGDKPPQLAPSQQDTPEDEAARAQWHKEQAKYSPHEQAWRDHMREIGTETVHGPENPAVKFSDAGGNAYETAQVSNAVLNNQFQGAHYGFNPAPQPHDWAGINDPGGPNPSRLNSNTAADRWEEQNYWHDVQQRSPLLRRSRNKLVHKGEAEPLTLHPHVYPWTEAAEVAKSETLWVEHVLKAETANHYRRLSAPWGNIGESQSGKNYPLEGRGPAVDKLLYDHGYAHYYVGGRYGKADAAKHYGNGYLAIHDPGQDNTDHTYTDTWRKSHELAHALTKSDVDKIYGPGQRSGGLGVDRSLNDAMRAVHWEWLATHKQRELLNQAGVKISDSAFHHELNTVMHDALHRSVTGKLLDPEMSKFNPHSHSVPLAIALDQLRDEAQSQGLSMHDLKKAAQDFLLSTLAQQPEILRDYASEHGLKVKRHGNASPMTKLKAPLGVVPKQPADPIHNPQEAIDQANAANRIFGTNASEPSGVNGGLTSYGPSIRDSLYWEDVDKDPNPYSDRQLATIPDHVRARSPILRRNRRSENP